MTVKTYEYDLDMPISCWHCEQALNEGQTVYVDECKNYYCSKECYHGENRGETDEF